MYRQLGQDNPIVPTFIPVVPDAPSPINISPGPVPAPTDLFLPQYVQSGSTVFPSTEGALYPLSIAPPGMTPQQAAQNVLSIVNPAQPAAAPAQASGSYVSTAPAPVAASVGQQFTNWLNTGSNKLYLALGGAIFVVAAVAGKKRRR